MCRPVQESMQKFLDRYAPEENKRKRGVFRLPLRLLKGRRRVNQMTAIWNSETLRFEIQSGTVWAPMLPLQSIKNILQCSF